MNSILQFTGSHLDALYFAHNVGQSILSSEQNNDPVFLEESQKLQHIFDSCNLISFLYSSKQVLDVCNENWKVYSYINSISPCIFIPGTLIGIFAYFITSSSFLSLYNTHVLSRDRLNSWIDTLNPPENIEIESYWSPLPKDELAQVFYIMQIASSITLIFLSSSPLFFAMNAFLQTYSFIQSSNRNSLRVSVTYDEIDRNAFSGPQDWTLTQTFRRSFNQNQECGICLNTNTTVYVCQDHTYHEDCISNYFYERIDRLTAHFAYSRTARSDSASTYRISYPDQNRLRCPLCNTPPIDFPQIRVTDLYAGNRQNYLTDLQVIRER